MSLAHRVIVGDAIERLRELEAESVQCCVTSPPYWGLRDYGVAGQLGLESTPDEYVAKMVDVFREVRRVLREDGTLWLNLGDCYHSGDRGGYRNDSHRWEGCPMQSRAAGSHLERVSPNRLPQKGLKDKDLVGIPWRVAFALQADGWWLRSDIVWCKKAPMPESVTDRPTRAHEYVFLLARSERYFYDAEAVKETANPENYRANPSMREVPPGQTQQGKMDARRGEVLCATRNRRSWWLLGPEPFPAAHFAVMPTALVAPCILAGSRETDTVLDPFAGSGTVGLVAKKLGRSFIGIELNPEYAELARLRIAGRPVVKPAEEKGQGKLFA